MRRVLVVDDEKGIREALRQLLEYEEFEVRTVSSGSEAQKAYAEFQPHLVFLDVKMQGMDGLETLKRLRQADPGALVVPGQVVARVITDDAFVRFAMSAEDARAKRSGFPVRVEVPGAKTALNAVVSDVQPEVDAAAQMVFARARLEIAESERSLVIPGIRVRVRPVAPAQADDNGGG